MKYDYLVVGSGLTGGVIARLLHDAGEKVLVLDRRSHLGGNVYDHSHESGIRIHTYGPHYFRTSDEGIWDFVNKFTEFDEYVACLKSEVDNNYENWPVSGSYVRNKLGVDWKPSYNGPILNFEDAALTLMPKLVYENFVKGYNIKQWGVDPKLLSSDLVKRFDLREDDDPRLMPKHKYQGIPKNGYALFMENLLKGIPVILNIDYLKQKDDFDVRKKVVFTGPIDEYFDFQFGKLKYRGQIRNHQYIPDVDYLLPTGQVNNPDVLNGAHIRTLEWKHMMPKHFSSQIKGTVLTTETTVTPINPEDFEYPFPDEQNKTLYNKYRELANLNNNLLICGRLGEYKYYDMDQAIGRAFHLVKKHLLIN
jgi:UDP-galactopyranose mutase